MKKRWLPILLILGLMLCCKPGSAPKEPVTPQQKASHLLIFRNEAGKNLSTCTGTAIGPHAILTAFHCIEDEKAAVIRLDMSTHNYSILMGLKDDRDHVILLIDGSALTNYIPVKDLINVAPARKDEVVRIYGNSNGEYPGTLRLGTVAVEDQDADVSDVDKAQAIGWYTLKVESGDSGSAIFAPDGRIVGVITYLTDGGTGACGFALGYSEKVINIASTFSLEALMGDPALDTPHSN